MATELETLTITNNSETGELWLTCLGSRVPEKFDLQETMRLMRDALCLVGPYASAASWTLLTEDATFVRRPGDDGVTTQRLLIVMPYIQYGGPWSREKEMELREKRTTVMGLLNYYGYVFEDPKNGEADEFLDSNLFSAQADAMHTNGGWGCEV